MISSILSYSFNKQQEISLYPTEGEFYKYYIDQNILDYELICKIDPQIPNVQIMNQCEEISQTQGNKFKSMSSNNTHFITLSYENEVTLYEWKNQMIEQIGESVTINSSFNCFSINLYGDFSILADCYQNNEFLLIQFKDEQSIIAYQSQSSMPTSTKMQSIINGTSAFLVYAQYFEEYSILSLFSSSFLNQSSLNNQFIDFDITNTISPNIYAITSQEIFQISISPQSQFYLKSTFSQEDLTSFTIINVYFDLTIYSQCDQILLMYYLTQEETCVIQLLGCQNQIISAQSQQCDFPTETIVKILQNSYFIIIQFDDKIFIYEKQSNGYYIYLLSHQGNSLLYFNFDNELFSFNQQIITYKISFPSLEINLTNSEPTGNNYTFLLICQNLGYHTVTNSRIYLQVLPKNDTNIYVMFNENFPQNQTSLELNITNNFDSFSGQLLQYKQNPEGIPLTFTLMTLQQAGQINSRYYLVQSLQINSIQIQWVTQYLIGYNNYSIDILFTSFYNSVSIYQFYQLCSINISVDASSLKVAYSIYPQMMIIGLSAHNAIYLFQYYNSTNSIISYSNYTFNSEFSDFLVTYNNIIILIANQSIEIMTFDFTSTFTLNQSSINNLFNNVQFNPIQIVVNTQLLSSLLYINNVNEVIIISIDQNRIPIPISLIKVNYTIKQINIINQQLILSYLCDNDQKLCFQVYNVQNLPNYYFVKNLYSVDVDNTVIIQSDNLFLYVTFSHYKVYVYNPSLPYHMSLYLMLKLTSPIQCAQAIKSFYYYSPQYQYLSSMIILSNNTIFQLQRKQQFRISVEFNNEDFNNSLKYPEFVFNYNVTSSLNEKALQQTPNQSIVLYSNFTVFLNQRNLSINLTKENIIPGSKNFSYPMNLILDRQVGLCESKKLTQTNNLNKYCSVTQLNYQNSTRIPNYSNFSLITSINNECFALQNNSFIQTVNSDLTYLSNLSYSNLNFTQCLNSVSNGYTLYSICENRTSQYLLNFTINCQGNMTLNETKKLPKMFQNISKINTIINQIFILGALQNSQQQQLYWLNQSNNNLLELDKQNRGVCQDFSIALIPNRFQNDQLQQISVLYIQRFIVYSRMMVINDSVIEIGSITFIDIQFACFCEYFLPTEIQYNMVLILQAQPNILMILVSDIYFSFIVEVRLRSYQEFNQNYYYGIGLRTIPNFGNLNNTGNSFYQNRVLMQQFAQNNAYINGVYFLNNLFNDNLKVPILMQGSFNSTISEYAMILSQQYENGTAIYFNNQSIYNYPIGTQNVTCVANTKNNYMNISIFCQNEFSNGTYNIIFYLPPEFHFNFGPSVYMLFSIIITLLIFFYFRFRKRTKRVGFIYTEVEL
ncbi:unnamed protein product (macronuclear) [Paramecium tetraurelia]|uniref:Transmembrane protein n=1 Tax=Paramecium tetraurelia TaxID=5888 RepID=A0EAB9_PARTE|nr:uncharacterized protein GSPATT00024968001 [Paramecium tetraurelia]CAK92236.1 unnamed protein product [Paramecium tetraurelia]|eukprot:XP_001459633.1 hypothetical protein (macronuclear) [Paramecium tetraurelia strain d4-2]